MTDPGLTNRLRQHSRRAGVMVGISMALTIAICLGGFVWIFAQVDPFLRDFVSAEVEEPEEEARPTVRAGGNGEQASEEEDDEGQEAAAAADEPTPTPEPEPTPTPNGFQPDYQSSSLQTINLRDGPSRDTALVAPLSPSTPLQYLDEDEPAADPALDGNRWMRFRTADGLEGWMREIDVEQFVP